MNVHRFISRLMGQVKRFFAGRHRQSGVPPSPANDKVAPPTNDKAATPANDRATPPTKRRARRPTTSEKPGFNVACVDSLKDLLNQIDSGIEAAHIDYGDELSNLSPAEVRALKRAGVSMVAYLRTRYFPAKHDCEVEERINLENPAHLPTTILLGMGGRDARASAPDRCFPDYLFALRHPSLPWYVEKIRRPNIAVYRVGLAYRIYDDRRHQTRNGVTTHWTSQFVCIDTETGEIFLPRLWRWRTVQVNRHCRYTRRERHVGTFPVEGIGCGKRAQIIEANHTRGIVAAAFDTADAARREWSVSISRGEDRLITYINPHDAPAFFRHRDIEDGATKRRRIFHIVKSHERTLANGRRQRVREHSRGERAFSFKGYQCLISSPRFHAFAPGQFNVPPVYDYMLKGEKGLDFEQTVEMVNDCIDTTPRLDLDEVAQRKHEYR
ncbi:hypothetical protein [Paraburkholderia sp. MM6662-R1]|uniref:hypothetical protein n=1 Tax=Paraburkholderia sp. MM6662-R1 TaxID=2991066 RepID=UPI003D1D2D57